MIPFNSNASGKPLFMAAESAYKIVMNYKKYMPC